MAVSLRVQCAMPARILKPAVENRGSKILSGIYTRQAIVIGLKGLLFHLWLQPLFFRTENDCRASLQRLSIWYYRGWSLILRQIIFRFSNSPHLQAVGLWSWLQSCFPSFCGSSPKRDNSSKLRSIQSPCQQMTKPLSCPPGAKFLIHCIISVNYKFCHCDLYILGFSMSVCPGSWIPSLQLFLRFRAVFPPQESKDIRCPTLYKLYSPQWQWNSRLHQ